MKFCSECSARVRPEIPPGEDRQRFVCVGCGTIHYENPTVLVAAFLHHGESLLWTQRGIEPNKGRWAFPAGFLERGETLQQAATRELFEETHIKRSPTEMIPMSLASVLIMDQLYVVFRCACETQVSAERTPETSDWGWFTEDDAPWEAMAYPESAEQVHEVYGWLKQGRFGMRVGEVTEEGGDYSTFLLASTTEQSAGIQDYE